MELTKATLRRRRLKSYAVNDPVVSNLLRQVTSGQRLQLIDVGARSGINERWLPFSEFLSVSAFEPDPEECAKLNAGASSLTYPIKYFPQALGSADGQIATLHICRQPGCSSLYRPNLEFCSRYPYGPNLEVVKTLELELKRMDSVLGPEGVKPDVMKIDTQGFELEILRGTGSLLDHTLAVELEVEFAQQYVGQPLFADVDSYMRSRGFELRGIKRSYWRRKLPEDWQYSAHGGQVVHGDALYVNPARLDAVTCSAPDAALALIVFSYYAQDDLVLDMLSQPGSALERALPEDRRRLLAQALTRSSAPWYATLPRKLLSGIPHRRLRSHLDQMRAPDATDWHDPHFY